MQMCCLTDSMESQYERIIPALALTLALDLKCHWRQISNTKVFVECRRFLHHPQNMCRMVTLQANFVSTRRLDKKWRTINLTSIKRSNGKFSYFYWIINAEHWTTEHGCFINRRTNRNNGGETRKVSNKQTTAMIKSKRQECKSKICNWLATVP